jgi:preprotein translocase subunit SecF
MEFIKPGTRINFIGKRKLTAAISIIAIVLSIIVLLVRGGPNYGVDFSGGVLVQVQFDAERSPSEIKNALSAVQLQDSIIQEFGEGGENEYLIRVRETEVELAGIGERVSNALTAEFGAGIEIRRVEMVGPKVGKDLRQKALLAIFYALLFIGIYISGRFELKWAMSIVMAVCLVFVVYIASSFGMSITWLIFLALLVTLVLCWVLNLKYALGAIIALVHDVIITVGVFALTDREISLPIIAAFLTIVGYSLNDTIIVFDRIRENLRRFRRRPLAEVMNSSINETLSRTILTSLTTLVVVVALFVLGGGVIHDFAFAILIGILVGTYSSIFVASPILLLWEGRVQTSARGESGLLRRLFS